MTQVMAAAVTLALSAVHEVPAGAPLAPAIAALRPGDTLRLGPGVHHGALGRLAGVAIEGAGAGRTTVEAPPGEDGLVAIGPVTLTGVSLRAGLNRCALKVLDGAATVSDAVLDGGACGAFLRGGRLDATQVDLAGDYALLAQGGDAALDAGSARGGSAGVALLAGSLRLSRFAVVGPAREAGVTIAGGSAVLSSVVIRTPGPTGIAIAGHAQVEGLAVTVSGAAEQEGFLGDCVQSRGGTLRLSGSELLRCGGAALEASGGTLRLSGLDAAGGQAGCLVLTDGASAALDGNVCSGPGPAVVAASGARATAQLNRWRADPALWVDCGSGARYEVGAGETVRQPCATAR